MKKIEAIIKPFKLDEVKDALQEAVFKGLPLLRRKVLAAKKATRNSIAAQNMLSIFFRKLNLKLSFPIACLTALSKQLKRPPKPAGSVTAKFSFPLLATLFASETAKPATRLFNLIFH